jgi:hypothetical protein
MLFKPDSKSCTTWRSTQVLTSYFNSLYFQSVKLFQGRWQNVPPSLPTVKYRHPSIDFHEIRSTQQHVCRKILAQKFFPNKKTRRNSSKAVSKVQPVFCETDSHSLYCLTRIVQRILSNPMTNVENIDNTQFTESSNVWVTHRSDWQGNYKFPMELHGDFP